MGAAPDQHAAVVALATRRLLPSLAGRAGRRGAWSRFIRLLPWPLFVPLAAVAKRFKGSRAASAGQREGRQKALSATAAVGPSKSLRHIHPLRESTRSKGTQRHVCERPQGSACICSWGRPLKNSLAEIGSLSHCSAGPSSLGAAARLGAWQDVPAPPRNVDTHSPETLIFTRSVSQGRRCPPGHSHSRVSTRHDGIAVLVSGCGSVAAALRPCTARQAATTSSA